MIKEFKYYQNEMLLRATIEGKTTGPFTVDWLAEELKRALRREEHLIDSIKHISQTQDEASEPYSSHEIVDGILLKYDNGNENKHECTHDIEVDAKEFRRRSIEQKQYAIAHLGETIFSMGYEAGFDTCSVFANRKIITNFDEGRRRLPQTEEEVFNHINELVGRARAEKNED